VTHGQERIADALDINAVTLTRWVSGQQILVKKSCTLT